MELFSFIQTATKKLDRTAWMRALIGSLLCTVLIYQLTLLALGKLSIWNEKYHLTSSTNLGWFSIFVLLIAYTTLHKWKIWKAKFTLGACRIVLFLFGAAFVAAASPPREMMMILVLGWAIIAASQLMREVPPSNSLSRVDQDLLNRKSTVDYLHRIITQEGALGRKVALTGAWGTGKSFALQLLAQKLEESNWLKETSVRYRVASANPWHCRNIEEFYGVLAKAFNEAVGTSKKISDSIWILRGVLRLVQKLPFFSDSAQIGSTLLEIFNLNSEKKNEDLIQEINSVLEELNVICVIYIEDFERADPSIACGVLSMLDELKSLKNTVIICALDRDKLRHQQGESPQGILEKVFDAIIPLPMVNYSDAANLIAKYPPSRIQNFFKSGQI